MVSLGHKSRYSMSPCWSAFPDRKTNSGMSAEWFTNLREADELLTNQGALDQARAVRRAMEVVRKLGDDDLDDAGITPIATERVFSWGCKGGSPK